MMTVREALANAVAHAKPKSIDIDVCFTKQNLEIEVRDDGRGFDPSGPSRNGHFGILGMQERVRLLQGSLTIESKPEQGARVRIVMPRRRRIMDKMWGGIAGEGINKN
jgi:two-component system sensor histidine kinase DegS